MNDRVLVEADARGIAERAAKWIAERLCAAVAERGSASVALSGGSTPRATFEILGGSPFASVVPWGQVVWFFGDERAVPPNHPDSNYKMALETLFALRRGKRDQVLRMPAEAVDAELAAREYGRLLPDPLDLVILGMGEDGHTASLFGGSPALDEREARVVIVTGPKPPFRRMTVTPRVVESAREVLVLVSGNAKAAMVARALEGPVDIHAVPVQLARARTWILDRDAASDLQESH